MTDAPVFRMPKRRASMGMGRAEAQGVFNDVFTSDLSLSHSSAHGDASRREASVFGLEPGGRGKILDSMSLHRGGGAVSESVSFIQAERAEPPAVVPVEENG